LSLADVTYVPEEPAHDHEIDAINAEVFRFLEKMPSQEELDLLTTSAVGGALVLGFVLPSPLGEAAIIPDKPWTSPTTGGTEVNAWVVIGRDDSVTIRVAQSEMGEGVFTSMPILGPDGQPVLVYKQSARIRAPAEAAELVVPDFVERRAALGRQWRHLRRAIFADRDTGVAAAEPDVRLGDGGHADEVVGAAQERREGRRVRLPAANLEADGGRRLNEAVRELRVMR
jgi:hypothetical protein